MRSLIPMPLPIMGPRSKVFRMLNHSFSLDRMVLVDLDLYVLGLLYSRMVTASSIGRYLHM